MAAASLGALHGHAIWGSARAATMANAATIVAATANSTCHNGSTDLTTGHHDFAPLQLPHPPNPALIWWPVTTGGGVELHGRGVTGVVG